ncbi:hypothetical protein ACTXT7_012038 [Hymenolepis weldensis]
MSGLATTNTAICNSGQQDQLNPDWCGALVINYLQLQIQELKSFWNSFAKIIIKASNNSLGNIGCYMPIDCSPQFPEKETFHK